MKGYNWKTKALTLAGLGIICITSGIIGYNIGYFKCDAQITKGIEIVWKVDPTLKDHMWEVLEKAEKIKNS